MKKLTIAVLVILAALFAVRAIVPGVLESQMNVVTPHDPYPISPEAQALHDSLFIADLHADSLLWRRDLSRESSRGQVDLPRLRRGNVGLQVFSATTKSPSGQNYASNTGDSDNITLLAVIQGWPVTTWRSLLARAQYQLDKLKALVRREQGRMILVTNKRELAQLLAAREADRSVVGAMYLIEGAHPLEGKLENLDVLREQGLHFVGITHFFDNALAGSLHGVSQAGLSDFGRDVIRRASALEMTIDIAHVAPAAVPEILALTERPVILSHGGFKGHCDTDRNLSDELMVAMAEAGGIVGVGYWDAAVCDPTPAGIVAAIRYGIDLLGEEHIALGSDYDGTVTAPFDTAELAVLTQAMLDADFSESEIRAVMGENVKRFLQAQLPD
jgi:microsomal dipeptidase-like Zn-dependent dipeptidase